MPFFNFKGAKIHYSQRGKGDSILLLHGFLGSEKIFDSLAKDLSKHFSVLIPDLPGHGKSENLGYIHTMELMSEIVFCLVNEVKLKNIFLVGHSMGGYVAMAFAEKYSHLLKGVCLLNSLPFSDTESKKKDRTRAIKAVKFSHNVFINSAISNLFSSKHIYANKKSFELALNLAAQVGKRGIVSALEGMKDRSDRTVQIKNNPQLFYAIMGRFDSVIKEDNFIALQRILPKDHFFILENSGHMTFLEEKENTVKKLFQMLGLKNKV